SPASCAASRARATTWFFWAPARSRSGPMRCRASSPARWREWRCVDDGQGASQERKRAPSPLAGEGGGGGWPRTHAQAATPLPSPPPQGGREQSVLGVRLLHGAPRMTFPDITAELRAKLPDLQIGRASCRE